MGPLSAALAVAGVDLVGTLLTNHQQHQDFLTMMEHQKEMLAQQQQYATERLNLALQAINKAYSGGWLASGWLNAQLGAITGTMPTAAIPGGGVPRYANYGAAADTFVDAYNMFQTQGVNEEILGKLSGIQALLNKKQQ